MWSEAKLFCHRLKANTKTLPPSTRFNHTVKIFCLFLTDIFYSLPPFAPLFCNVHQEFISVFASSPSFALLTPFTTLFFLLHLIFPSTSTVSLIQIKALRLFLNSETKAKSECMYITLRIGGYLFNDSCPSTCVMKW